VIQRTSHPRVHGLWTAEWWTGADGWRRLLGNPPSADAIREVASRLATGNDWSGCLHPVSRSRPAPPGDALVCLAGQQPVFGGGAALVVHKAATAVAMAQEAERILSRPVVPVFLLATQDHDSDEVDHADFINPLNGSLVRARCRITPQHEMFSRAAWDDAWINKLDGSINSVSTNLEVSLSDLLRGSPGAGVSDHPAHLIDQVFGDQGLLVVESHRMAAAGQPLLDRALGDPASLAAQLRVGARGLRELGITPAFDPEDPRPLVLETQAARRARVTAQDDGAQARLAARPEDFSPHAALRPVVQATALPVLAQVCGPSELLYLAQSRGLHTVFDAVAPLLVPRMEATRLPAEAIEARGEQLLEAGSSPAGEAERALASALEAFQRDVSAADPGLRPRLERFARGVTSRARRLAEMPSWRGRAMHGLRSLARPRGRWQDAVLAWLPDALACGDLGHYGRHLVSLCRPLDPPVHVLHSLPEATDG
jgi:hypothetical protein